MNINQDIIDDSIANNNKFWKSFHDSIKLPYSSYNEKFGHYSYDEWLNFIHGDKEFQTCLNLIFDNSPVLISEFPIAFVSSANTILTNFRLFIIHEKILHIIPLSELTLYEEQQSLFSSRCHVEYGKNEKTLIKLKTWMLPKYINDAKDSKDYEELNDIQNNLLKLKYDNKEIDKELSIPKISFLADAVELESNAKSKDEWVKIFDNTVDYEKDEFKQKITIKSRKSIVHDMTDFGAVIGTAMKSYTNVLDSVNAGVRYVHLTPRYVESPEVKALVIDLEYTGNDWIFFNRGSMIILADDDRFQLTPQETDTDVHGGGKVDETLYYKIDSKDFQKISKSIKIEIQITGQKGKVEFSLSNKQMKILKDFDSALFNKQYISLFGIDPFTIFNKQSESKPQISEVTNIEKELEKLKGLLDKGLITQEQYNAKSNELLGL